MAKIEIMVWYSIYRNDWFATSIVQAMLKVHFQWKWQSKIQGEKNDAYCFSSETCGPVQVYLCNEYLSHSIRRKIVERNIMHWTRRKRRSIQCSRLIHTALNFLLDSMLIYNEIHHHNRTEFISPPQKRMTSQSPVIETCDRWTIYRSLPLAPEDPQSFPGIHREGHRFQSPQSGCWPRITPLLSPIEKKIYISLSKFDHCIITICWKI